MLRNSPTALRLLKCALNAADDGHAGIQVRPETSNLPRPLTLMCRAMQRVSCTALKGALCTGAWRQRYNAVLPE